ncbi:MAG TPA: 16S rRNA processing protein RimM [Syntrophomonadaceae bacterium]|nr:16S rRNA processing protein RimM [Syntrophomonadaceae bacterium]
MDLVKIGQVVGAHGVQGTIKVESLSAYPERFQQLTRVTIARANQYKEYTLVSCKQHKSLLLITLDEITNRDQALDLIGAYLCVPEDQIYPLPVGEYYHFQLIGMKVYDKKRGYLGELDQILETGANDVYVIQSPQYGEMLIPAIQAVIQEINLDKHTMQVDLLEGLIEENHVDFRREQK